VDITIPEPPAKETVPDATPESLAQGKALLQKAAPAEKAVRAFRDLTTQGTASIHTKMGDMDLKVKTVLALPGRSHSTLETPMGPMTQVFDGERSWMAVGGQHRFHPASTTAEMKQGIWLDGGFVLLWRALLDGQVQAQALGKTTFEGQEAEEVFLRAPAEKVRLYLVPGGKTILGARRRVTSQEGPKVMTEVFSDYHDVSGLQIPFKTVQKDGEEVVAVQTFETAVVNAGFDPKIFDRPAEKAE
jgi:hypothetical protein